jgi:hypothetical protein
MSKKTPKKPQARGRPTDYKPEFDAQLISHMQQGLSFESFGGVIGKSKQTLYDWLDAQPTFLDAKMVGAEASRLFWEELGIHHILNTSETQAGIGGSSKSLNASVYNFQMKNRFGWRDKQPDEVANINVNFGSLTDEQLIEEVENYKKLKAKD